MRKATPPRQFVDSTGLTQVAYCEGKPYMRHNKEDRFRRWSGWVQAVADDPYVVAYRKGYIDAFGIDPCCVKSEEDKSDG